MASLKELARVVVQENRAGCTGKIGYDTQRKAMLAAVSFLQRNGDTNGKPMPYHCCHCGKYHIGRKKEDRQRRDNMLKELLGTSRKPVVLEADPKPVPTLSWVAQRVAKGRNGIFCEVAEITPEIAAHLLDYNDDNRKLKQALVDQIASDIANGFWQVNGEAVIVSKDGFLNDGQHRLEAIIKAGKPVKSVIVFGVDRDSRMTVDMGAQRTLANFLGMNGIKYETAASAVTSLYFLYRKGYYNNSVKQSGATKADLLGEYQRFDKQIQRACHVICCSKFLAMHGTGPMGCAYVILRQASPEADYFFEKLASGEDLPRGSPILMLRNVLIENKNTGGVRSNQKLELLLRYWNAWRDGRTTMKRIALRGEYPEVSS